MRTRSNLWISIVQDSEFIFDVKLDINGTEYTRITAPKISRACMNGPLTVGDCISSMMEVSIDTTDDIPRSAEIKVYGRVLSKDRTLTSEWLPFGIYFIDRRPTDYYGMVTLSCYDAMLKADVDYPNETEDVITEEWPKSMSDVVEEIAERMGVEVDENTTISSELMIDYPQFFTLREILGYIGAVHGGNWIINRDGKLALIKLFNTTGGGNIDVILGKFDRGIPVEVKGILTTDKSGNEYTNGDIVADGVIRVEYNPYVTQDIADALWDAYEGCVYYPFEATRCITDPAFEMGDPVQIGDNIFSSHFYIANDTLDNAYVVDLSCPPAAEMESEYPFKSASKKLQEQVDRANTNTNTLRRSLDETNSTITSIEGDIDNANDMISRLNASQSAMRSEIDDELVAIRGDVSSLNQTASSISASVSSMRETYDGQISDLNARLDIASNQIMLSVQNLQSQVDSSSGEVQSESYGTTLKVVSDGIEIDEISGSNTKMHLTGSELSFPPDGGGEADVYFGTSGSRTPQAQVDRNLTVGEYKWIVRSGSMSLVYIGE